MSLKDIAVLESILLQLGLPQVVAAAFCKVFHSNRHRIHAMKGSLGVSEYSFKDISWRLDIEVISIEALSLSCLTKPFRDLKSCRQ